MSAQNVVVRFPPEELAPLEAQAEAERRNRSEVVRTAVRQYCTGSAGDEALRHAVRRAQVLQAKLDTARAELADIKASIADDVTLTWREDRFIAALEAAVPERPVAKARLMAVSGWKEEWVTVLLTFLVKEGYITRPQTGFYAHVPGAGLRDGLRIARREVQRGTATISPSKREAPDGSSPAPSPDVPAAEATPAAEAQSAARKKDGRIARVAERAEAAGAPLVAARDLPRPAVSAATAVFQEPGAGLVVTAEVPEAAPGKPRGSSRKRCEHRLPAGAWCKTCQQPK